MVASISTATFAQNESTISECEEAPAVTEKNDPPASQAMWSVLFNYDLLAATGSNGKAAVCVFNNEFWVSRWANDTLYRLSATGTLIDKFTIASVTGCRSLTTDGTHIYAGVATNSVKKIDPVAKTLVSTITAPDVMRSLTYDATANGGLGGFWGSNWGTDIYQFDMNGTTLNTIPAGSHLMTGMYGTAFDNTTVGGPFLWVFDQGTSVEKSDIVQVNIATQSQTGVVHDVMSDVGTPQGDTSGLAGGMYFHVVSNVLTLVGVLQGSPTNRLFGYEVGLSGINENKNSADIITISPNPVKDMVNISLQKEANEAAQLEIFDVTGKAVFSKSTRGMNNYINLSKYNSGIYLVKATVNGNVFTSKLIKQ